MVSVAEVCRTCMTCKNNDYNNQQQQQHDSSGSNGNKSQTCFNKNEDGNEPAFGSCGLVGSLIALAYIQFVDSISVMVVLPSLVFYVKQVGGTINDYGIILSFFSLSSVISKPILGIWVDSRPLGSKYKIPYYVSIIVGGILGGILYFIADCIGDLESDKAGLYENYYDVDDTRNTDDYHYYNGYDDDDDGNGVDANRSTVDDTPTTTFTFTQSWPVLLILVGRLLGGFGQANETLRDAYLSVMIPPHQFTTIFSLLNMTRVIGLAAAPGFQVLLDRIHWYLPIPGYGEDGITFHVTSLNSVGLFMAVINFIALIAVWVLLEEPTKENMVVQAEEVVVVVKEEDVSEEEDRQLLASQCNPNDEMDGRTTDTDNENGSNTSSKDNYMIRLRNQRKSLSVWESVLQIEIILPMMVSLFINSAFHL